MVNGERDAAMVRLYSTGETLEAIGERFGVTRERVRQIVRRQGATSAEDARRLRQQTKVDQLTEDVAAFLDRYRELIVDIATTGVSRVELEARFHLVHPEIPAALVRRAIDSIGALFDRTPQDVTFSDPVLENAVWFALARERGLEPDHAAAVADMNLEEADELAEVLRVRSVGADVVATILGMVHAARRHARTTDSTGISKLRYTAQRDQILNELGPASADATVPWPPTSMTLGKRLGNNSWGDAQRRLGLTPDSRGRPRGLLDFTEDDYEGAIRDFLSGTRATGTARTFEAYCQWVNTEERAGRRRPSGPSIRLMYGSWNGAKRLVAGPDGGGTGDDRSASWGPVRALTALHDAQDMIDRLSTSRETTSPAQAVTLLENAVRMIVQDFEYRRRHWLRTAILTDKSLIERRINSPGLSRKERGALEGGPSAVEDLFTDLYLDRLGSGDPTDTGGWLRPGAQAELTAVSEQTLRSFTVLKEYRNLITHGSAEARARLTDALARLGECDPKFVFRQSMTARTLGRWLISGDAERLDALVQSVPALWRAMVVAETVLTTPADDTEQRHRPSDSPTCETS